MKKSLLTLVALFATLACMAGAPERMAPSRMPAYDWAGTDTVTYTVTAQSYVQGSTYNPNGGDVKVFKLGVVRDGERVVFTNVFDSYYYGDAMQNHDLPIEGKYDSAKGTISFASELPVIDVYGSYVAMLKAGQYDQYGQFYDELDNLIFNVDPDFNTITATSPFGALYKFGWGQRFKSYKAYRQIEGSPANLIAVLDEAYIGRTYPTMPVYGNARLVNLGGSDVEYVVSIEDENGVFSASHIGGNMPAFANEEIEFLFDPKSPGHYEAKATIETEDGQTVTVNLVADADELSDFSQIVTGGDFTFETSIDYPAELVVFDHPIYDEEGNDTGETEKVLAAMLTSKGVYGQSTLKAKFTVPEGKEGRVKLNGFVDNPTNQYYLMNSFILVDDDDIYRSMYCATGDYKAEDREIVFAPGDHYLYFVNLDGNSHVKEVATYVWGLNLTLIDPEASGVEILTPEIFIGYGVFDGVTSVYRRGAIELQNKGTDPLEVISITCDDKDFQFTKPTRPASLLENLTIPFVIDTKVTGDRIVPVTIETSAGTVVANIEIYIIDEPDYSTLFTEGLEYVTQFAMNETCPFVVEDGKAYNITSQRPDIEKTECGFGFEVNIPEGETGHLYFTGHNWGTPADMYVDEMYWDYGFVGLNRANGQHFWGGFWDNDIDVNDTEYWERTGEEKNALFFDLPEGLNRIEFGYTQEGNGRWYGQDRLEIYTIGIRILGSGIDAIYGENDVTREYYDLSGRRLDGPQKGINIVRTIYPNGNIKTSKIVCSASR